MNYHKPLLCGDEQAMIFLMQQIMMLIIIDMKKLHKFKPCANYWT